MAEGGQPDADDLAGQQVDRPDDGEQHFDGAGCLLVERP